MSTSNNINIIPTKVEYISDIFAYNIDFKVLICTSCHSAIKKTDIKSHISLKHKEYKNIETITAILEKTQDLSIYNPQDIPLPRFNQYYFQDLDIISNLYRCQKCEYAVLSYKALRNHLNQRHKTNLKIDKKEDLYLENQYGQRFSNYIKNAFFIIKNKEENNDSNSSYNSSQNSSKNINTKNIQYKYIDNIKEKENKIYKELKIKEVESEEKELSSFLLNTNYHEFLKDLDINKLLLLTQLPIEKDNKILFLIYTQSKALCFKIKEKIQFFNKTTLSILQDDKKDPDNTRPFKTLQNHATKDKYYQEIAMVIIFSFRIFIRKEYEIPAIKFNKKISMALENININIEKYINNDNKNKKSDILNILEETYIYLIIALIKQDIKASNFGIYLKFNSLLIGFFIIQNIDSKSKVFKTEEIIEKSCSTLIYSIHLYTIKFIEISYNIAIQ